MRNLLMIFSVFALMAPRSSSQVVRSEAKNMLAHKRQIDSLLSLLPHAKNDTGRAAILWRIAQQYKTLNRDSSLFFAQQSYALSRKAKDTSKIISTAILVVDLYSLSGSFPQALDLALKTMHFAEHTRDTMSIFWATRSVWRCYSQMLDFEKVLEYSRRVKTIVHSGFFKTEAEKQRFALVGYIIVSSVAYEHLDRLDSALYYGRLAYQTAVAIKAKDLVAITTHNLGDFYRKKGEYENAETFYRKSITSSIDADRMEVAGGAYVGIARLFAEKQLWDSALHYGKNGIGLYQASGGVQSMLSAYAFLSDIYEKVGRIDSAYKYQGLTLLLKDSLFNQEKTRQVKNIGFDDMLRLQQLEQEKRAADARYRSQLKTLAVASGFIMLLLFLFFLYRNNRQQQKANVMLQRQKSETEQQKQKAMQALDELQATQAQLIQREKMASLGELTAGVAHEIQNPLNFVNNFSDANKEMLAEMKQAIKEGKYEEVEALAEDLERNEAKILHHGKRADSIVKGMLQHARVGSGKKEQTAINQLAEEYLNLSYQGAKAKDKSFKATIKTYFDEAVGQVAVVPQDIGSVLLNLYNNAFYAVRKRKEHMNGAFEPMVIVTTARIGDAITIAVKDNGTGIPEQLIDKIYQPFFTTKPTGDGIGLGLSLSYDIISKGHRGYLSVRSVEGEGSEFVVQLPA